MCSPCSSPYLRFRPSEMIYASPCKINIGLSVLARRSDGYHDIETAMVAVSDLCDVIEVIERPSAQVEFSCGGIAVDCPPESNLALRAYRAEHLQHR